MIEKCPWCQAEQDSDEYDEDWYFACCGVTRLVWIKVNGILKLQIVLEEDDQ